VLWIGAPEGVDGIQALQAGAHAILNKALPVSALLQCLRAVGAGHLWMGDAAFDRHSVTLRRNAGARLTPRERDVVRCVVRGLRNREVAAELGITRGTVKVHLMHVFEKTGAMDRLELAAEGHKLLAQELTVKSRSGTAEE
jgi:DNA-binding NarL/FixJ family response regulator